MPIDFPSSPATDEIYSFGGRSWKYNGVAWVPAPQTVSTLVNLEGRAIIKGGVTTPGGPASLAVENDIWCYRPAENSGDAGALFLNDDQTAYLYWDGTDFRVYAGTSQTKGRLRQGPNGRRVQEGCWISSAWNYSGLQGNGAVPLMAGSTIGFAHDGNTAFYCEDPGTYMVTTGGLVSTPAGSPAYVAPYKNGAAINSYCYYATSQLTDATVSQMITLAVGDYIQAVFFNVTANVTLFGTGHSHFVVHRVD